jgi:hypothetical protein
MIMHKNVIEFEELSKSLQHALEIEVEWHSVLVYEIKKSMYGLYILDEYMPGGSDFTGLIDSDYVHENDNFIQESVQKIIESKFKGTRCKYFPKGCLSLESLRINPVNIYTHENSEFPFSIEIHSNDYGFLDEERAQIAPAYAHVLDKDILEVGLFSITGPCPHKIADIKEFRPPHKFGESEPIKITPLKKYMKYLVRWANSLRQNQKCWEWAQQVWKMGHIDTR